MVDFSNGKIAVTQSIARALRSGRPVMDQWFDGVFPGHIQALSDIHWTPVRVARRAAQLLVASHKSRILDVGSGCGKFCIVGAITTPGQFIGVEQRPCLVDVAQGAARSFQAGRATFIQGDMSDLDWDFFDSFYLFNPFYENRAPTIRIDQEVVLSEERFASYVSLVQGKLKLLRPGTRVVTYHGFGGDFPVGYRCLLRERAGSDTLNLWVKRRPPAKRSAVPS